MAEPTPYLAENTGLVYVYANGAWSDGVTIRSPIGPKIESFPPFSPVIARWEYWLDASFNRLDLLYRVRGMKKIRLALASANPAISGNIAVAFVINDIESAVGATETALEHVFATPVCGKFAIVRRIENPLDALRDGIPVTARYSRTSKWSIEHARSNLRHGAGDFTIELDFACKTKTAK